MMSMEADTSKHGICNLLKIQSLFSFSCYQINFTLNRLRNILQIDLDTVNYCLYMPTCGE